MTAPQLAAGQPVSVPTWPTGLRDDAPLPFVLWRVLHHVDGVRGVAEIAGLARVGAPDVVAALTQAATWVRRANQRTQPVTDDLLDGQHFGGRENVESDLTAALEAALPEDVVHDLSTGDGDLVDTLVDALTNLADAGFVVLLTPKAGHPDHVDASEIEEAAVTAGLHTAGGANASAEWSSVRLVAPRGQRR